MDKLIDPNQKDWLVQSVSLTTEDMERLDAIQAHYALPNRSAAIRACIYAAHEGMKND